MDSHVYGYNRYILNIIQVHSVPMKCERYSSKVKFWSKPLKNQNLCQITLRLLIIVPYFLWTRMDMAAMSRPLYIPGAYSSDEL